MIEAPSRPDPVEVPAGPVGPGTFTPGPAQRRPKYSPMHAKPPETPAKEPESP